MRLACALVLVCAAGCHFALHGADGGIDNGGDDLATGGDDLATGDDLSMPFAGDMASCNCPFGCSAAGVCLNLKPSGPASASDYGQAGLMTFNANANITFDTMSGAVTGAITRPMGMGVKNGIYFRTAAQSGGPGVGIFAVAGFTLAAGATMSFNGPNAFVLVSSGPVEIDGTVDASCGGMQMPGPGGGGGGMPGMPGPGSGGGGGGPATTNTASGGGGGGYGDNGGNGGLTIGFNNNGGIWGELVSPTFILAGGAGGGGGGAPGGGGGGAVMFSVNSTLVVSGTITVGGCGGAGGMSRKAGGGGGAGGAIVLEAGQVTLTGTAVLAANGGGGGGGDGGGPGDPGAASASRANGGTGQGQGGDGGKGGAGNGTTPGLTVGQDAQGAAIAYGGGGGGGCGRIAVRGGPGGIKDSAKTVSPNSSDRNAMNQPLTVYGTATFQ